MLELKSIFSLTVESYTPSKGKYNRGELHVIDFDIILYLEGILVSIFNIESGNDRALDI